MATRRTAKPKQESPAAQMTLLPALKFIEATLKSDRDSVMQHCMISNGWLVGTDGTLTVGMPINEELHCFPHASKLRLALERCDDMPIISLLDAGRLSVKSGKFKAVIECIDASLVNMLSFPDAQQAPLTDAFKAAVSKVRHIATEQAEKAYQAAVTMLEDGTVIGCDGVVAIQAWHGQKTPPALLPKKSADAICNVAKPLAGIGAASNLSAITFYYEDKAFIKTQLYVDKAPNFVTMLEGSMAASVMSPLPAGLYEALTKIKPFVDESNSVIFSNEGLTTSLVQGHGASVAIDLPTLNEEMRFSVNYLFAIKEVFEQGDFSSRSNRLVFAGNSCRGVLMGMRLT